MAYLDFANKQSVYKKPEETPDAFGNTSQNSSRQPTPFEQLAQQPQSRYVAPKSSGSSSRSSGSLPQSRQPTPFEQLAQQPQSREPVIIPSSGGRSRPTLPIQEPTGFNQPESQPELTQPEQPLPNVEPTSMVEQPASTPVPGESYSQVNPELLEEFNKGPELSYPNENYAYSNSGVIPNFGQSSLGKPLTTERQYKATQQETEFMSYINKTSSIGQKILDGDEEFIETLVPNQGLGASPADFKNELADIRAWGMGYKVKDSSGLPEGAFGDIGRKGVQYGLASGVTFGGAALLAGPAAPVTVPVAFAIGFGVGFIGGAVSEYGTFKEKKSTKEERKDIREAYNTCAPIIKELNESGLGEEADMLMDVLQQISDAMVSLGDYATEREVTSLVNDAQTVTEQIKKLKIISDNIKSENQKELDRIETAIALGGNVTDAELGFAIDNGSSSAINRKSSTVIAQNENNRVAQQELNQSALITKSSTQAPKDILNDAEWISYVSDPNNEGTLAYNIYLDAQEDVRRAKEDADARAYNEYLDNKNKKYNEELRDEQRAYNEEQRDEQRAYNEAQTAGAEATAVEASGTSSLNFGILNGAGDTQYVDRDKASQFYFSAPFEELTPAQKRLLMLSKGE